MKVVKEGKVSEEDTKHILFNGELLLLKGHRHKKATFSQWTRKVLNYTSVYSLISKAWERMGYLFLLSL